MSVTKDSFRDWKANPVTKAVFAELRQKIAQLQTDLGSTAGIEPLNDRYKSGAIAAFNDILLVDFDEVTDGN